MKLRLPFGRGKRRGLVPTAGSSVTPFSRGLPWLLGSLLLVVLPLYDQIPIWTVAVFGGCIGWRYWLERAGRPLPSMPLRLLLSTPVAYLVLRTYGTHPSATGLLAFLVALLSLKILELRTARDFTIVALLGYFMVLSALFYNQSLYLCLYLAAAVLMNSAALLCGHGGLRGTWPTLRLALGMAVQALPLVLLLFVVFPRVQFSFLHRFGTGQKGQMGMSDQLQPGSVSALVQSNDLAFRARIVSSRPLTPGQLYWRGLVLERCEHPMAWRAIPQPGTTDLPQNHGDVEQQITVIPTGGRWLFALDRPVGVKAPAIAHAEFAATQTLRSRDTIYNKTIYTAYSSLFSANEVPPRLEARNLYLQVPGDVGERARALVKTWRQSHTDDEVLRAAALFFRSNDFTYTLNPGLLPRDNALDYFLFTSRRGFCEHYAAAYSTLMRMAGIPARVVVGYQGGEFNQWGGHYTIRQADAHAWSEVWLAGRGWVREDPTGFVAPERVSYGAESYAALDGTLHLDRLNDLNTPGSLRWLLRNGAQLWDSADQQWNLLVLGYDQDAQLTLLEKLRLDKLDWVGGTMLTLAVAFTILGLGAAIIYFLDRRPVRRRDVTTRLYERFCRKLAAGAGLQRAPTEGPLDFARRAADALPGQANGIRQITDLYVASRYARDGSQGVAGTLRDAVKNFRVPRARA